MKRYFKIVVILVGLFIFAGCSKLSRDDFDSVGIGMSESDVVDVLGKPSKTINNQKEIKEIVNKDFETATGLLVFADKDTDAYDIIYENVLSIAEVKALLEKDYAVKCLMYKCKYEDSDGKKTTGERYLYFYNDKLLK